MNEFVFVLVATGQCLWLLLMIGLILVLATPNGPAWWGKKLQDSPFVHGYFYLALVFSSIAAFWFPPFFR